MSAARSAIASLHKELASPSAPRKITKAVKSPSPSRRAEGEAPPEPLPSPFRDVRYQSQVEFQRGGAYAVSEEEFEDWEPQVGPSAFTCCSSSLLTCLMKNPPLHPLF